MKEFREVEAVVKELVSITCNCCGKTFTPGTIECNDINGFEVWGAYGTESPPDLEVWRFDVCGTCLGKWVDTFKHHPAIGDFLPGVGELEPVETVKR